MIMAHGTPEQRQRFLPEILGRRGRCTGSPTPNQTRAPTLASLRAPGGPGRRTSTSIDGQKIWTTTYYGEYLLVAARTDPDAHPKTRRPFSVFMVPSDAPGITQTHHRHDVRRELRQTSSSTVFASRASARLGPENDGWAGADQPRWVPNAVVWWAAGRSCSSLVRLFELLCEELRGGDAARVADSVVRGTPSGS